MAIHDELDAADRAAFNFDPRSVDWPTYISTIHLPSIVHHARAKTKPGKSRNDRADRLRRSVLSPERHVAAFDLENTLIASNVVESYSWLATRRLNAPERVRYVLRTLAEAPTLCCPGPQGPRRLPALLLPPLRGRAGRPDRRGLRGAADQPDPHQELPRRASAACASTAPSGIARSSSPARSTSPSQGLRPLFDEIIAAEMTVKPDGTLQRRAVAGAADRRDPGADPGRLLRRRRACAWRSRSPTPTRPATCRCSRRSASRSPSTPRPGSRRSPASAVGSSSTGRRLPAGRGRCCRSARCCNERERGRKFA